jgi:hypothetical protein
MERLSAKTPAPRVDLHRMRALDFVLMILILLGSAGVLLGSKSGAPEHGSPAKQVVVNHDGTVAATLSLQPDREIQLLEGKMVLLVKGDRIRVQQSDCPRQHCVRQGWVKHDGEALICVPYRTVIEVRSSARPVVDAVIY